jgi:putative membrane protein
MTGFSFDAFLNAMVFAVLGIVLFMATFFTIDKLHPADFWKEIIDHKNTALAILLGAMSLGICIIIAAAVH